jgi:hypothetical protein
VQCGSCWAFAPIAALESALAITQNKDFGPEGLSEQELVDCVDESNGFPTRTECGPGQLTVGWVVRSSWPTLVSELCKGRQVPAGRRGLLLISWQGKE